MDTLLVVDDDPDIREALRDVLEGAGWRVEECRDGGEACAWLQDHDPPALLLLDLMMPVMSGGEVLEWMRGQPAPISTLPVVVVSAMRKDVVEATAAQAPVVARLLKPFPMNELLSAIARHARRAG